MAGSTEEKIKMLLSVRHKLQAQLLFYNAVASTGSQTSSPALEAYVARVKCLLGGIRGLLLLLTEDEAFLLELHLVQGMKWEAVMEVQEKRWSFESGISKRTYLNRQQAAIKKIKHHMDYYAELFDFSWLDDPLIEELATADQRCTNAECFEQKSNLL